MDISPILSAGGFIILFVAIGLTIRAFGGKAGPQKSNRHLPIDSKNPAIYWGKRGVGSTLNNNPRR